MTQAVMNKSTLRRDWGLFVIGLLVALSGILMVFWPGLTLVTIAIWAGAMLLVGGIFQLVSYFRLKNTGLTSGWDVVNAICSLILGLMFLIHPVVTAAVIPMLAGIFVLFYGGMAIASAISMRKTSGWGIMLLNGIVSILCGILFIAMPESFAIYLAVFLIMYGVTLAVYGLTPTSTHDMI